MSEVAKLFKESATQLGVFYPKHYLMAVFRNLADAEKACLKLRTAGFAEDDVFVLAGPQLIEMEKDEAGLGSFAMQALSRFFATEQISTDEDLEKARHGAGFVAVYCPKDETKGEAQKILGSEAPVAARYYGAGGIEHLAGDLVTN